MYLRHIYVESKDDRIPHVAFVPTKHPKNLGENVGKTTTLYKL